MGFWCFCMTAFVLGDLLKNVCIALEESPSKAKSMHAYYPLQKIWVSKAWSSSSIMQPTGPLCIVLWEVGVGELVQESADILDTIVVMSNKVL